MSFLILKLIRLLCVHLIIPQEIKKFIGNNNKQTNIFRIQAYNSVTCGYFCIGFIDFVLKDKSLTDFTNLFSPNDFKKMMI